MTQPRDPETGEFEKQPEPAPPDGDEGEGGMGDLPVTKVEADEEVDASGEAKG